MAPELDKTAVSHTLQTHWLGHSYHYFPALGSTNDYLKQNPQLPHGTVALTDYQQAGRGRFDRTWQTPPGTALLLSVLLRPRWPAEQLVWVGMIGALAAKRAIEDGTGLTVGLKWPNDLMLPWSGGWGKLGGLLLETMWHADGSLAGVILGMGLNVNVPAEALPETAVSLQMAQQQPTPRLPLLCQLLQQLEKRYEAADAGHSPHPAWEAALLTLGQQVQVTAVSGATNAPTLTGIAESTDRWGRLLVRDNQGTLHSVAAGDVTLRR